MALLIGQPAPDFSLPDQTGQLHQLSQYRGQWVLVYFYPRDNTPGCTREACELRDAWADLAAANTVVLGISSDSVASHQAFADQHHLPFPLLADINKEVIKAYDAWQPKSMFGHSFLGIQRRSVLIDPQGAVAKIYPKVQPAQHAREVWRDVRELTTATNAI